MGFVSELVELIHKLDFYTVVYEYQVALKFQLGKLLLVRIPKKELKSKFNKSTLETKLQRIERIERYDIQKCGGQKQYTIPFYWLFKKTNPLPQKYYRSWYTGKPLHPNRFSTKLRSGFYLYCPILEYIITDSGQERVLNLGTISVLTTETNNNQKSESLVISCNIRYRIADYEKAFLAIHDYEASLKDHTLSILAKHSRGKTFDSWKNPKEIDNLEKLVAKELRTTVTDKWGLELNRVYITDNVPSNPVKIWADATYSGTPIPKLN